jgi:cytochrome b subunit of formate dehydrogenase
MILLKKIVAITFMLTRYILQGISGFGMLISGLCFYITAVTSIGVAFGCEAPNGMHPYMACFCFFVVFIACIIIMYVSQLLPNIDDIS